MSKLQTYLDNMVSIFYKRGEDFTLTNIVGEEVPVIDYLEEFIPEDRVESDAKKMIKILHKAQNNLSKDEFLILIAAYCNYYIEEGIMLRITWENWGLNDFFSTRDDKDIVFLTCDGVVRQDYSNFEKILELDKKCTVANVYLFVKCMSEVTYRISKDKSAESVEKKAWGYYEQLEEFWKKYVIQEKEEYPFEDRSPIPYIFCKKRETNHFEDMLIEYTKSILEDLSIQEFEPRELYNLIQDKYHVEASYKPLYDFLSKNKFYNDFDPLNFSQEQQERLKEYTAGLINACATMAMECTKGLENRVNTKKEMTFLFEKLGYLVQMTDLDRKEQYKFEILDFPQKEDSILYRYNYVHIPMVTCESISMRQLVDRYRLFSINRELKKTANQKKEMMDYYAHSWKHISYPQIVKEIAEELGATDRKMSNRLMKAYNSERTLQRGIQLLQFISSDDEKKVSKEFKSGMAKSGVNYDTVVGLKKVICDSLDLVVFKILMVESDDSSSIERCREKWSRQKSLDNLRNEYTELFLEGKNSETEILQWVDKNLIKIDININHDWDLVRFKDDNFAVNQFKEILVEIFTNVFLHGEKYMKIDFTSNDKEMIIAEKNACSDTIVGSRSGISTMQRVLEYINIGTDIQCIDTNLEDAFNITIKINKSIMIRRGR